jgi:1,4-dihydroxy-6-naphthoate synthase
MDRAMISEYVQMWVNDFTVDPGPRARQAVAKLLGLEPVWIQG